MPQRPEDDLPLFREKRVNDPAEAIRLLAKEAKSCTRCDLYKNATQTVFGEGPANAALMLVGEEPGDQEDLAGQPFALNLLAPFSQHGMIEIGCDNTALGSHAGFN